MKFYRSLRLYTLMVLFGLICLIELIVNQFTHSLTVLADCYHNLYFFVLLMLLSMSHKTCYGKSLRATFGWARIEVLGTLVNIIFTIALCFSAIVEGIQILVHSDHRDIEPTNPELLLICGILSLIINLMKCFAVGELIRDRSCYLSIQGKDVHVNCIASSSHSQKDVALKKDCLKVDIESEENIKLKSIEPYSVQPVKQYRCDFIDILRNCATSSFLTVTSCIILHLNVKWSYLVDPIVGMFSVVIIFNSIYPTMKESGLILLQTVPKTINVTSLKKSLYQKFPSILNIHDLHIWCLTSDKIIATFHMTLSPFTTYEYTKLNLEMKIFLFGEGISLATIQPEFQELNETCSSIKCRYTCSSTKERCDKKTCCHQSDQKL